jgi:hypothetical protein
MPVPMKEVGTSLDDVICPFCSVVLQDAEAVRACEEASQECEHVFLLAHDEGIEYLSDAAKGQLRAAGFTVDDSEPRDIEIQGPNDEASLWEIINESINGEEAQVLAVYAPAPVFAGSYFGVARSLH